MAAKKGSEIRVGIFMVISLAMLIVVIITMSGQSQIFKKTYALYTIFDNVAGMIAGAEVRLSGITVGVVDDIQFSQDEGDTKVYISMQVDDIGMERIMKDSQAMIQTLGLLGKKYVEVLPGTLEAGHVVDGDYILSVEPISMTEALDKGGKILDDIGKTATYLEQFIGSLSSVEGKQTDISQAIGHLKNVIREVEQGNGVLHALIYDKSKSRIVADLVATAQNLKEVSEEIKTGDGTIHELVYGMQGKELVANLASASKSVDQIVSEIQQGKGFLHSIIYEEDKTDLIVELKRTAENLRLVTEKMQRGEGTIGALLVDPSIYEDIKKITGEVERSSILKAYIRYTIRKNEAADPAGSEDKRDDWGDREG